MAIKSVAPCYIRGVDSASYRSGQWAQVLGVVMLRPDYCVAGVDEIRPCYVVLFPDGEIDYWPVYKSGYCYEFITFDGFAATSGTYKVTN